MRFWPFGKKTAQDAENEAEAEPPVQQAPSNPAAPQESELVRRLLRIDFATPNGESEASHLLASSRGTSHEARVVDVLLERLQTLPLGEGIRVQTALVLVDRGERKRAEDLVAGATSARALFMAAELAELRGELPVALTRLERVLARDVDYPGAKERHKRLRASLGLVTTEAKRAGVTALVPQADAPYKLLREVARGGAGAVYEATDPVLARPVALKMLHDPIGQTDTLLYEMTVTAALSGAGVIRVLDADAAEGWLAFEWAPFGSLREILRDAAKPADAGSSAKSVVQNVARWLPQVARALARVHARGYVHGDVKPANLLFLDAETPVLSDFGIAKRVGDTLVGGSMGYLSPDRLRATVARPWHDVYGFGRLAEEVAANRACPPPVRLVLESIVRDCLGEEAGAPSSGAELAELVAARLSG